MVCGDWVIPLGGFNTTILEKKLFLQVDKITSAPKGAWKCNFPPF